MQEHDDHYEDISEEPDFSQLPNYDQHRPMERWSALDSCSNYLARISTDLRKSSQELENRMQMNEKGKNKGLFMKEGNIAYREGDYIKALKLYDKATNFVLDSPVLYINRAMTWLKLGKPNNALVEVDNSLYWSPDNFKALIYKAQALYLIGKITESYEIIEKLSHLYPEQIECIKGFQKQWVSTKLQQERNNKKKKQE